MSLTAGLEALNSLRSLYEIARDVRNSNDPEKLKAAAAQMFDLAVAAREQTAVLQEERNMAVVELAAVKAEIEEANKFDEQVVNYIRERNYSGATVYREKDAGGPDGASPYFCPNCFAHKKFSMLNPAPNIRGRGGYPEHSCPNCHTIMPLQMLQRR